jgi:hypothetical protein
MSDLPDLERRLTALRDEVAWPQTPDVAAAVRARLAAATPATAPARRRLVRPAPAVAFALLVVLALGAVLAASPEVRARFREWLGLGAARIERVERLPDVAPARALHLGRRTTLAAAARATGLPLVTIRALGAPDAVYLSRRIGGGAVSLVYAARPGLPASTAGTGALLGEFRGDPIAFVKQLAVSGRPVRFVDVGQQGVWIQGPHAVKFLDRSGLPVEQQPRLAGSTLLWSQALPRGGLVTYRLETALSEAAALRLARSVGS